MSRRHRALWGNPLPHQTNIQKVQAGNIVQASGNFTSNMMVQIPAGSTAGNLLVVCFAGPTATLPAGWVQATPVGTSQIWYLANCGANITSVPISFTAGLSIKQGALSEWSGVATTSPLDATGVGTTPSQATSTAITSAAPTTVGELVITTFALTTTTTILTFTPDVGYLNAANNGPVSSTSHMADDYLLSTTTLAAQSETETSNFAGTWTWAIATFLGA